MINGIQNYFDSCNDFFADMIAAKCDEKFVEVLKCRADKIARDLCLATDDRVTDILKGQLSICYELADGITQAKTAREGNANPEQGELSLEGADDE